MGRVQNGVLKDIGDGECVFLESSACSELDSFTINKKSLKRVRSKTKHLFTMKLVCDYSDGCRAH